MSYALEILRSAQKQLAHIDRHDQLRIITAIRSLADEPHPAGSKKLSGRDAWRIRVGTYRIIYEIQHDRLLVLVVSIGHRRAVYR
ncbi:MAG: type II toxin-antitoxin system RelE/ParE family toxin [Desulfuromonadaceae bacterium]|nr:type II toxin-antitoxin system RelE/ParE family toxin [Desulfuromonadaceae bacterium]